MNQTWESGKKNLISSLALARLTQINLGLQKTFFRRFYLY